MTGAGFEAVILRDHVVLGLRDHPGVAFEMLSGGGRTSLEEVLADHPAEPSGLSRVGPGGYLPFYLDNLASRLAEAGRPDDARVLWNEAFRHNDGIARLHFNYGTFLLQQGDASNALAHMDRALELGWTDVDSWVNRGVALHRLGKRQEARRSFLEALEIDPDDRRAKSNLALLDAE